jgi:hypothetical protein
MHCIIPWLSRLRRDQPVIPTSNTTKTIAQTPLNHKVWNSLLVLVKVRHYPKSTSVPVNHYAHTARSSFLRLERKNRSETLIWNTCIIAAHLQPNNYTFIQPSDTFFKSSRYHNPIHLSTWQSSSNSSKEMFELRH